MRGSGKVALGRLVLSRRERVIALDAYDKGLLGAYRETDPALADGQTILADLLLKFKRKTIRFFSHLSPFLPNVESREEMSF